MKSTEKRSVLVFSFSLIQSHITSHFVSNYHENTLSFCYHKKPQNIPRADKLLSPAFTDSDMHAQHIHTAIRDSHVSTFRVKPQENDVLLLTPLSEPHFYGSIFSFRASKGNET